VRAAADLDRLDDADAYADLAASLADPGDIVVAVGRAMGARAEALLAREDAEGAAEVALDAVTLLADAGAALDAQVVRVIAGRALGEAGRRDEAIEVLQVAAAEASRGAALRLRDEAARELRRLGSRLSLDGRRGAGPATFDELSEREREIADLAARGQANKQIAATLFLSQKTVEHHLSSVYAKLGLRSRVELAALVGETAGRA